MTLRKTSTRIKIEITFSNKYITFPFYNIKIRKRDYCGIKLKC
jgi:hypothetical protein